MTHSQLIDGGVALLVLLAGLFGYSRRRGSGSSGRSGGDRPRPRPRAPRPGPRAGRPPAAPSRGAERAPSRLPEPREIWWAEVPFEDGPGSKDRPCLVLHRGAVTATVLKITSKHHTERPGVLPLPPGTVGDREHRASWLETDEPREVPLADFRRRVGAVDAGLWNQVQKALA
ncbi:type II toxin-antitoxin system PemK/MazF family toxin [Streptacidiphilus sp. N1-12]|uniref:Type II toxin-antitoxin system PemK/MazF family toxin n=2 Tax=Streptacidiphilus alkalitolerans TaxID=3342712 RepID=A0ABV6WK38_9ACTN